MFFLRLPLALFNLLWQSAFLALGQIWTNKVRAMLTTVGIVIGVASVTAVIAALTGLKQSILDEFESFGTNKIYMRPTFSETSKRHATMADLIFRPREFDGLLEHCPSVRTFTRETESQDTVSYGSRNERNVPIFGIDPAWHTVENRSIVMGRPFSLVDEQQGRPVCLINAKLQQKLALPRDPTGVSLLVGDRRYKVIGIIEAAAGGGMFERESSNEVYVPFRTLYHPNGNGMWVVAAARSPAVADEARAEIAFFLRKRRHVPIDEPDNFEVQTIERFVRDFNTFAAAVTLVATCIVGISLLVGGVGIMNIMFVSVSERTREIGLRKAVGARPSAILLQFLVEAVMLCLLGGLVGLLLGEALTRLMKSFPQAKLDKASIPPWAIALSFGFAATVGVVFGMFPAIKAARLDPIEALRHE